MRILYIFIPLLLIFKVQATPFPVPIRSESAILINGATGKIIYEKNANKKQYPASMTKVATAILAIQKKPHSLQEKITASQDALGWVSAQEKSRDNYTKYPSYWMETGASHIGIKRGEVLSFQDLLYGLMLASGDDAANVIAEYVGAGSIPSFMNDVNALLQQLGCTDSYFCNPHGLYHPDHVTTCRDMARLCRYAMQNELFRKIVRTARYERPATNKQQSSVFLQTNKLVRPGNKWYYKEAVGIKTGYLSKAQRTLACAAEKDGRFLIAIFMRCADRNDILQDARTVFETAFAQKKVEKVVLPSGNQSFQRKISGAFHMLETYMERPLLMSYYPNEDPEVRCQLLWDKVSLPIKAGTRVGEVQLFVDGVCTQTMPVLAKNNVDESFLLACAALLCTRTFAILALLVLAVGLLLWGRRIKK